MMTSVTRLYFTTQHKTSKTKTDYFWSQTGLVLRPTVSHHITGLGPIGGAMWAPQLGSGRSPSWLPKDFFTIFSTQDGLSWHYNIVLLWIKKWKILNPFNLESITVHFGDAVWCFFSMRLHSQSESGKCMVFTAGKRRGRWGDSTLGEGNPPSSAGLRPHGPWRTLDIRGHDPTWNLSFIFIYDFWKYKSRKNWNRIGIFQIELTPKESLV